MTEGAERWERIVGPDVKFIHILSKSKFKTLNVVQTGWSVLIYECWTQRRTTHFQQTYLSSSVRSVSVEKWIRSTKWKSRAINVLGFSDSFCKASGLLLNYYFNCIFVKTILYLVPYTDTHARIPSDRSHTSPTIQRSEMAAKMEYVFCFFSLFLYFLSSQFLFFTSLHSPHTPMIRSHICANVTCHRIPSFVRYSSTTLCVTMR